MLCFKKYSYFFGLTCFISTLSLLINKAFAQTSYGTHDTLLRAAVIFEGDTIEAKTLSQVYVFSHLRSSLTKAKWTRLRNAVYVTYPYARRASMVFNDINAHIANNPDKAFVRHYINTRAHKSKK